MDFLNKLSKKATETYQATKEKAITISEELKIKGKISDLKEKVEEMYLDIGKIVYNELKDGKNVTEEEILLKCEEISKSKDEISKLKSKLLAIKKIKKCDNCGAELEIDDRFCSKCGKEQPVIENVEIKKEEPTNTKEAEVLEVNDVNPEETNEPQSENGN